MSLDAISNWFLPINMLYHSSSQETWYLSVIRAQFPIFRMWKWKLRKMKTEASLFFPLVQPIYMLRYGFMWMIIRCGQILKLLVLSTRIQFGSFLYNFLSWLVLIPFKKVCFLFVFFLMKFNSAELNQPLPFSVRKTSITNITRDCSCLFPVVFAGIGRRRQGCILGTDVALISVTLVQALINAFVLIATFWSREVLLSLFYRCLCTEGLIGQSWNRPYINWFPSWEEF